MALPTVSLVKFANARTRSWGVGQTASRSVALVGAVALALVATLLWRSSSGAPPLQAAEPSPVPVGMVALTFDDGPNGEATFQIARILEEHGVKATFFEVGMAVEREPEAARYLLSRGHVLGNHSYRHGADDYLRAGYPELARGEQAISRATGVCPALFRPPFGAEGPLVPQAVAAAGMHVVRWDVSAEDWIEQDPAALSRAILERVRPGSIILLHDGLGGQAGVDRTVVTKALPSILDGLRARGLQAVTLDQLLGVPAYLGADDCGRYLGD